MTTPQALRKERLANDFVEMKKLDGDVIRIKPTGSPPHQYELELQIRSIVGPGPEYRNRHAVRIELGASYPEKAPVVRMLSEPPPFHPNWWKDGVWCSTDRWSGEPLAALVIRLVRMLRFEEPYTNPKSPANKTAREWYLKNRNTGLFPTDRTPLPSFDKAIHLIPRSSRRVSLGGVPPRRSRMRLLPADIEQ